MGYGLGKFHQRPLSDPEGSASRTSEWLSGQTPKLILITCVLISDIQWFFVDEQIAWVAWSVANWIRCAALCMVGRYFASGYAMRAWCAMIAVFFISKVPLELLPPGEHVSPLVMYPAFVLYVATGAYIIHRHDSKRNT